jgi:hypothetical protein
MIHFLDWDIGALLLGPSSAHLQVEQTTIIGRGRLVDTIQSVELSRKVLTSSEAGSDAGETDAVVVFSRDLTKMTVKDIIRDKIEIVASKIVAGSSSFILWAFEADCRC